MVASEGKDLEHLVEEVTRGERALAETLVWLAWNCSWREPLTSMCPSECPPLARLACVKDKRFREAKEIVAGMLKDG